MTLSFALYRVLFIVLMASALAFATYAVASAPSRIANRLGVRGLKRKRALEDSAAWAQIEPLVRWLGVRFSGILSDAQREGVERRLMLAGDWLGITADEFLGLSFLSLVAGLGGGLAVGQATDMGIVMVLVVGPLAGALPYLQVQGLAQERLKSIGRGLPYAVDLIALAMSAGKDFPGAIRQVVEKSSDPDDPVTEEFARILQELSVGRTRRQALLAFKERAPIDQVVELVNSVVQAEEKGNPLTEVLQVQASMSRMRRGVRAEKSAAKAGVAMVGPLAMLLVCILALVVGPMFLKLGQYADDN